MRKNQIGRTFLIAGLFFFGAIGHVVRAEDQVANPKYTAWSKFKPGSSNTIATDMEMRGAQLHIEVKRTLVSVTDDQVVIEVKSTVTVAGHDHDSPGIQQTINAKTDKDEIQLTGEKDVDAMGKTFKCKVYEATAKPDAKPDQRVVPGANMEGQKATVYACDDVPGGLVKLETETKESKPLVFVLTTMETK